MRAREYKSKRGGIKGEVLKGKYKRGSIKGLMRRKNSQSEKSPYRRELNFAITENKNRVNILSILPFPL